MTVWLFFFSLGLMGAIIAHGIRQQKQIAATPDLTDKTLKREPGRPTRAPRPEADVNTRSGPKGMARPQKMDKKHSGATLHALTIRQPWLLNCVAPTLTWADLYATLDKAQAVHDPHSGLFHVFDAKQERLLYSVSKADAKGALPSPYSANDLRNPCRPFLLMLPLDESRNAHYDAMLALSALACELINLEVQVKPTAISSLKTGKPLSQTDFEAMLSSIREADRMSAAGKLPLAA